MRRLIAGLGMAASLSLVLASCGGASPRSTLQSIAYGDPAKGYLGMSQAEIISCAGQPHSRYGSGAGSETLTFRYSGAGPVPGAAPKSDDKKKKPFGGGGGGSQASKDWTCSASLVFESGRLTRVTFAHREVRSPYDWQSEKDPVKQEQMRQEGVPSCTFSLPRCPR
ncbi:MAG: hypothetical protein ACOYB4_10730 [Methyloceanibacter sp.]